MKVRYSDDTTSQVDLREVSVRLYISPSKMTFTDVPEDGTLRVALPGCIQTSLNKVVIEMDVPGWQAHRLPERSMKVDGWWLVGEVRGGEFCPTFMWRQGSGTEFSVRTNNLKVLPRE